MVRNLRASQFLEADQFPITPSYDQNPGVALVLDSPMARINCVPRSLALLLPGLSLVI
jgi:hypothetical protein